MRKRILISFGILLCVVPLIVLAQFPRAQMSNCCVLKHDIEVTGVTYTVAAGGTCPATPPMPPPTTTTFRTGCIVSERAAGSTCYSKGQLMTPVNISTPDWGGACTMDTIATVTDFIFWIFLAFSVVMGIYVGIMFMTAGGNPSQQEKARSMIVYVVIGIVVAIAVKLIPSMARAIIGV